MAAPTAIVRQGTYLRDDFHCQSCGTMSDLQYQHRIRVGMGGSKIRPTFVDGMTSCAGCNWRYEADLQPAAIRYGWKVLVGYTPASIPVYDMPFGKWYRLLPSGTRLQVSTKEAMMMMQAVYQRAPPP